MDANTIVVDFQDLSIEGIDAQIRTLRCYIQKLQVARNALLPIRSLPPEILLHVFTLVAKRWDKEVGCSVLKLTWVSHYWRELALSPPNLWTLITDRNMRDEWFARSGSAPLSIKITRTPRLPAEIASDKHLQALFAQIPRVGTFQWYSESFRHSRPILACLWKAPALRLTSLILDQFVVTDDLFCKVPNIRSILLKRCKISWQGSTTHLLHLTSLRIIFPTSSVSVSEFVDLIHAIPSLEQLIAIGVLLDSVDDNSCRMYRNVLDLVFFLRYAIPRFTRPQTLVFCVANHRNFANDPLPRLLSSFLQIFSPSQVVDSISSIDGCLTINYRDIDNLVYRTSLEVEMSKAQVMNYVSTFTQPQNIVLTHVRALYFKSANGDVITPRFLETIARLPSLGYLHFPGGTPQLMVTVLDALLPSPLE
ncbi:hypothetical protein BDN72DRAFT_883330 [Pluteus cervinus]|uniref:Uncharacterized protein n=1 Tax=Pluteus cervinus TaxID=181527 RepID=A0ACD3A700_9AGAR|nr:hypothetical protein BDN72DRAFT_883330 [Pluteus cervinus]